MKWTFRPLPRPLKLNSILHYSRLYRKHSIIVGSWNLEILSVLFFIHNSICFATARMLHAGALEPYLAPWSEDTSQHMPYWLSNQALYHYHIVTVILNEC